MEGQGLGWIDVHLLASVTAARARLWTKDRSLLDAAGAKYDIFVVGYSFPQEFALETKID